MKVLTSAYCMKPAFIFMAAVVNQVLLFVVIIVQCLASVCNANVVDEAG